MRLSSSIAAFAALLAALLLAGAPDVRAQDASDGDALLAAWRTQQTARLRAADGVAFALTLDRTVDGPKDAHRLRADVDVRVRLDGEAVSGLPRFDADVQALEVDGETMAPADYERATHPLRRLLGRGASWLERPMTLPYPILRIAEARDLVAEMRDGQPVWRIRVERLPRGVDAATFWFVRNGDRLPAAPRLVASEVRVAFEGGQPPRGDRPPPSGRPPRGGPPGGGPPRGAPPRRGPDVRAPDVRARLDIVTDYARAGGLDLPASQSLTLVAQQRRRIRTFTVLVEQSLRLRDVRVIE
ncbi:MAG: hypothetical protein AAFP18_07385 [Bacteroidota bacterium]